MILVDTNIPLRIAQVGHPHRQVALDALEQLTLRGNERFAIAPQSLYEMYVVLTRPAAAGGGRSGQDNVHLVKALWRDGEPFIAAQRELLQRVERDLAVRVADLGDAQGNVGINQNHRGSSTVPE